MEKILIRLAIIWFTLSACSAAFHLFDPELRTVDSDRQLSENAVLENQYGNETFEGSQVRENFSGGRVSYISSEASVELEKLIKLLKHDGRQLSETGKLKVISPYNGSVFPPEIAAPFFSWKDENDDAVAWLLRIEFDKQKSPIYFISTDINFRPSKAVWETTKRHSVSRPAIFSVISFARKPTLRLLDRDTIQFFTSPDSVGAPVLYRQLPLPFKEEKAYTPKIKWRLGDISAYQAPPVVMGKRSVCSGCHSSSTGGTLLSMEMDYKNDSGAQFVTAVTPKVVLSKKDFMSWNDFPRSEILPKTHGPFARLSPSGRYIVGTVHDIGFMVYTNELEYSRLFFPTHGILGWYDRNRRSFSRLPGADDHELIQTAPAWSPDERYILYSRAETHNQYHRDIKNVQIVREDKNIETLNRLYPIRFNIYRLPFNNGDGGTCEPFKGASNNGYSNYFPRYSPDGKWVVFTRSPTGIGLQPDSKLYIIPAKGGRAREMTCNRGNFNSWHSWSPNGKWVIFSSKAHSPYTELFLTHIDRDGADSPPVRLGRFSDTKYAANIPEFINISPDGLQKITLAKP